VRHWERGWLYPSLIRHILKPLCFKRINLEKIKVFDFVCNNGWGGGGSKRGVLIKEGLDKKTIVEITEQVVFN
jgi:hypothetical protein